MMGSRVSSPSFLGVLRSKVGDSLRTTAHRFIAEDDLVVVEARGSSTTKAGIPYNNTYWVVHDRRAQSTLCCAQCKDKRSI